MNPLYAITPITQLKDLSQMFQLYFFFSSLLKYFKANSSISPLVLEYAFLKVRILERKKTLYI